MRGTVAVHASLNMNRPYYARACKEIKRIAPRAKVLPYEAISRGSIIGLVDIISCEKRTKSKWHVSRHYGFRLANARPLRKPITCKGRLGFWEVPTGIARRISHPVRKCLI
jgi:hypothetical protein